MNSVVTVRVDRPVNQDSVSVYVTRYSEPNDDGRFTKSEYLDERLEWVEYPAGGFYQPMMMVTYPDMIVDSAKEVDRFQGLLEHAMSRVLTDVTNQDDGWLDHDNAHRP